MLGLLLIFFIGKYFYELAQDYYKHKWLYAILGVVSYYAGTMIGGFVIAIGSDLFGWSINFEDTLTLTLIAIPFGILSAVGFYFLLKRNWKNSKVEVKDEIQDIGINIDKDDV
jgi:MFS family permease